MHIFAEHLSAEAFEYNGNVVVGGSRTKSDSNVGGMSPYISCTLTMDPADSSGKHGELRSSRPAMDRSIKEQRENSLRSGLQTSWVVHQRALWICEPGVPSPPENVKVRLFSEAIFLRMKKKRAGSAEGEKL